MKYLIEAEVIMEFPNKKELDKFIGKNVSRLKEVSILKDEVWHKKQWRHLIHPKGIVF